MAQTSNASKKPAAAISNQSGMSRSSSVPYNMDAMKGKSLKNNCLCSPTTHAGSFRCRYHRNMGLTRSGMSVGSKLSELGGNQLQALGAASGQQVKLPGVDEARVH